jgi:murein DD-endopeptidase MepM/ murein hydrolase activator NlpD
VGHHSQRRAADLLIEGPDGKTYRSDGRRNEDYFAYGTDVLAVADGTVTGVVDGVAENVPGTENPAAIAGNFVTIRHSDYLYSVYAHLQPGKMRVHVGEHVLAHAVIGICGNSGNSSQPHLHFQLQDGPSLEESWGVEAVFADVPVTRQGRFEVVPKYTFHRGDRVGETTPRD